MTCTGTLIQNRYSEMWSVLDFCFPGGFGTHQQWEDTIGRPLKAGLDHDASVKQLADKQVSRKSCKCANGY
jgi:SNF2 family DNA or RNA helicase